MFRKKKPVITITFDPYHNLPMMKAKNCSRQQILDAALFMEGHARFDTKKNATAHGKKKIGRIRKFFRILRIILFRSGKAPTVEKRMEKASAQITPMLPASV